jgi:hypothetical protein
MPAEPYAETISIIQRDATSRWSELVSTVENTPLPGLSLVRFMHNSIIFAVSNHNTSAQQRRLGTALTNTLVRREAVGPQ